jgi:leucyl/phenylalanyl-tRNA---protein transferase
MEDSRFSHDSDVEDPFEALRHRFKEFLISIRKVDVRSYTKPDCLLYLWIDSEDSYFHTLEISGTASGMKRGEPLSILYQVTIGRFQARYDNAIDWLEHHLKITSVRMKRDVETKAKRIVTFETDCQIHLHEEQKLKSLIERTINTISTAKKLIGVYHELQPQSFVIKTETIMLAKDQDMEVYRLFLEEPVAAAQKVLKERDDSLLYRAVEASHMGDDWPTLLELFDRWSRREPEIPKNFGIFCKYRITPLMRLGRAAEALNLLETNFAQLYESYWHDSFMLAKAALYNCMGDWQKALEHAQNVQENCRGRGLYHCAVALKNLGRLDEALHCLAAYQQIMGRDLYAEKEFNDLPNTAKAAIFPPPEILSSNAIVLKQPLSPELILEGYSRGCFVWGSDSEGVTWGCPDPRLILRLDEFHISKSLKRIINSRTFEIRVDHSFTDVMEACRSTPRHGRVSSWITDDIIQNYTKLNKMGYAHSVESWVNGKLVGGLYGTQVGNWFVGESMFSLQSNASKAALVGLVSLLKSQKVEYIDCHVPSVLMQNFGARVISRVDFYKLFNTTDRTPRPNLFQNNANNEG